MIRKISAMLLSALLISGCCSKQCNMPISGLNPADFVTTIDGQTTALYTLTNANGMEVCVTNYGGRIVSIMVPDRDGKMQDAIIGYSNINDYAT